MATSDKALSKTTVLSIRDELDRQEDGILSPFAARSRAGIRRKAEARPDTDYRQAYALDADRILHSHAYARYIDKTQVFYLVDNDHITHRVLHVQLVSKIARTIGRFLSLNQDLIEAIALGHDIGHSPFGHDGERFLSRLCRNSGIGYFHHNVQSVQFLEKVERRGEGWNLCLQTLDGILCHDGEVHNQMLRPAPEKTFDDLQLAIRSKRDHTDVPLTPMTIEGCVVRMADTIAYVGRDIEDAIRLNIIKRSDLPPACVARLGETNGTIVYNLVTDIIRHSHQQPWVAFGEEVSGALERLKRFNLERIYLNPKIKRHTGAIRRAFSVLFEGYCRDIETENRASAIYTDFLADKSEAYRAGHQTEEMVRDFIAGMTDRYFLRQCPEQIRPDAIDL